MQTNLFKKQKVDTSLWAILTQNHKIKVNISVIPQCMVDMIGRRLALSETAAVRLRAAALLRERGRKRELVVDLGLARLTRSHEVAVDERERRGRVDIAKVALAVNVVVVEAFLHHFGLGAIVYPFLSLSVSSSFFSSSPHYLCLPRTV